MRDTSHSSYGFTLVELRDALKQRSDSAQHKAMPEYSTGFTLVELGIALVVIGLLIGGIIKGAEVLENARAMRQFKQMHTYEAAMITFRDSYGVLPGDIPNPAGRLPNCSGAGCVPSAGGGTNGNGNGLLEPISADIAVNSWAYTDERNFVFPHLAAAGLIPYDNRIGGSQFDDFPPGIMTDAQIRISHINAAASGNYPALNGVYVMVGNYSTSVSNTSAPVLLPKQAMQIDMKIDNARPFSGNILGVDTGNPASPCMNGLIYNESLERAGCNLLYRTGL